MAAIGQAVLQALSKVKDPALNQDIVSLGLVKNLKIHDAGVSLDLQLTEPDAPGMDQMKARAIEAVRTVAGVASVEVNLILPKGGETPHAANALAPTVKHIIPVASGKGGVGKSTVTVNLAHSLVRRGASVGIMDADVYGPSIPTILGVKGEPDLDQQNRIYPLEHKGIKVVSMGFFMNPEDAVIWRGPMLHKTVQQFLGGVLWGDLDYLLVDLPPGTGDVQLSLCQSIPITGAIIVSTPQPVAIQVAQKAVALFRKLEAPVLGMIENMVSEVFGSGGAEEAAKALGIPYLGSIPLASSIRLASDSGEVLAERYPDEPAVKHYGAIAEQLELQVGIRAAQQEHSPATKIEF